jgi:hypothetical protein
MSDLSLDSWPDADSDYDGAALHNALLGGAACVIHWRPINGLNVLCEVRSTNAAFLQSAAKLFAPWLIPVSDALDSFNRSVEFLRWCVEEPSNEEPSENGKSEAALWKVHALHRDESEWADSAQGALSIIEYAALRHMVEQMEPRFFGLHGALLSRQGRAVLVVGPKTSGKSTLSCALWKAGWSLHCDDFTLIDNHLRPHPTARRVSIREGSRELLGEEMWQRLQSVPSSQPSLEGWLFHPYEVDGTNQDGTNQDSTNAEPLQLTAVVFLARRNNDVGEAELKLLDAARAALALMPHSTLANSPEDEHKANRVLDWGTILPLLTQLTSSVVSYDLGRGPLPQMIAQVEQVLQSSQK